ncbi:MAG TPA: hypothetical protein VES93_16095 [Ornithinibacter sp.]|nr:hypothetical protein [Ornithinibacter sp.]
MTTTTASSRPAPTASRARTRPARAVVAHDRRTALVAGLALAVVTALSIPATALLDTADLPVTRSIVGVAFLVVAALEVVVGWGLYVVLRERAQSSAYAALVSRAGYAVLLTAAAGRLLWPGGDGVAGFRADWSLALLVLGVHLLVTSVALWHSRGVPGAVVAGTAVAGTVALLGDAVGSWPLPDVVPGAGPLLPGVLGGLVLVAWLFLVGGRVSSRDAG